MPVTDQQVAALKALLTDDRVEHERLMDRLDHEGGRRGYYRLLVGAFGQAVRHRFGGRQGRDIVAWVAEVRARWIGEDPIDPTVAERSIFWVFGKASMSGIDTGTRVLHQSLLLQALVEEQRLDEEGLDAFLRSDREFVDTATRSGSAAGRPAAGDVHPDQAERTTTEREQDGRLGQQ